MSFDWSKYFVLAEVLIKAQGKERLAEEYRRSAISRGYYFVFHLTKAKVESDGFRVPIESAHSFLINTLDSEYGEDGITYAEWLKSFRKERTHADYFPVPEFLSQDKVSALLFQMRRVTSNELNKLVRMS